MHTCFLFFFLQSEASHFSIGCLFRSTVPLLLAHLVSSVLSLTMLTEIYIWVSRIRPLRPEICRPFCLRTL